MMPFSKLINTAINVTSKSKSALHTTSHLENLTKGKISSFAEDSNVYKDFNPDSPVCSWNEWDPLEEVIVGTHEGAVVPEAAPELLATISKDQHRWYYEYAGRPWADCMGMERWNKLQSNIKELITILEGEGCTVKQPEYFNHGATYVTPFYTSKGFYASMPRDLLIISGDEIIEATMSWRSRTYEYVAFRPMILDYWKRGAKWTTAPKPLNNGKLIDEKWDVDKEFEKGDKRFGTYVMSEYEPAFDAADCTRVGKDYFMQVAHTTNKAGIEWLRRHLAPKGIRVHEIDFGDPYAMHIDCTFYPLKPGIFFNKKGYPTGYEDMFEKAGWKCYEMPKPKMDGAKNYMASEMLAMNLLLLDEKRAIVEKNETGLQDFLKTIGITPILCNFTDASSIGGGFHCWTSDIRRRGTLQSYF